MESITQLIDKYFAEFCIFFLFLASILTVPFISSSDKSEKEKCTNTVIICKNNDISNCIILK